jgi:hypothetical protein
LTERYDYTQWMEYLLGPPFDRRPEWFSENPQLEKFLVAFGELIEAKHHLLYRVLFALYGTPLLSSELTFDGTIYSKENAGDWICRDPDQPCKSVEQVIYDYQHHSPDFLKCLRALGPGIKKMDEEAEKAELPHVQSQTIASLEEARADHESTLKKSRPTMLLSPRK